MILLPRPHPHLARTLEAFTAAGLTGLLPLALSHPAPQPISVPPGATAIIFTSIFGVHRALPRLPACCVGEQTSYEAEKAGFPITIIGTSNAEALARSIINGRLKPQHFLHPHGDKASFAWHEPLRKAGHIVTPLLAYRTQPVGELPASTATTLNKEAPTHTLLFSAGSAKHLAKLLNQANISPKGTAVCFSPAVAQVAKAHWPRTLTATSPTLKSMLTRLKKDLAS